jgi:hypothetical protein
MNKSSWMRQCLLAGVGALLLQCLPVFAGDGMPGPPHGMTEHNRGFDWVQHTRHTVDELKVKLNLAPGQTAAWDAWSAGVMKDAQQQAGSKMAMHMHGEMGDGAGPPEDATTPEQMAHGIERLRGEISMMQEHLARLEAAQARTKTFYDTLDTNQKTIFDLFWHEMYHRMAGHDGGWGMHGHEGFGPGPMGGMHEGPADCCTEHH